MNNKFHIAVSACSTSCDRYSYLFEISDFNDLVKQLKENCYDFETGSLDEIKLEAIGVSRQMLNYYLEFLYEINEENYEKSNGEY